MDLEKLKQQTQIGSFRIEQLTPGEYQITESRASTYYVANSLTHNITVTAGGTQTLNITNDRQKSKIHVLKVDARDNRTPIGGCTFELYSSEDNYRNKIATKTTPDSGEIEFTNLRVRIYL